MPRNDYLSSDSSSSEREYKKYKSKKRKEKADSDHEKIRKNKRHKTRSRSPEYQRRRSRNEDKYDEEISKKRERKEKSIERHHVKSKDTDKNISKGERRDRRSRSRSREEKSSREGTKKSKNKHKHDKKRERSPSSEKRTDRERDVTRKHEKGNTSSSSDKQNSYKKRNTDKDDASPVHKKIDKAGRSESVNKDDNTKSKSKKKDKVRNKSESSSKKDKNKDKYIEKSSRRSRRESTEDPDINKDFEELNDRKVVDYGDYEYNSPQSKKRDVGSEGEGSNEESEIKKHSKSKSGIKSSEKSNSMKNGENQVKEVNDNKKSSKGQSNLALKKVVVDPVSMRTGGAYIPPARLKMMQDNITDKSSDTFQRLAWEALKKSINGIINKLNVGNIGILIKELFQENLVRGRGILCRSLIQAQAFSPTFTHVYAALVCVLNSKFPQIGELLLHRLIIQFRRGIKRNDKNICMASCKFLAHLVNVQVVHEILALEMLTLLLEKAKDVEDSELAVKSRESSIELTIAFLKESGNKLQELTPKGLHIIIQTLRNILHEGKLEARFKYMIEVLLKDTKTNFSEYPAVIEELDIVEESEKYTHIIELDGKLNGEEILNVFKSDPNYIENENKYKELKDGILRDSDDSDSGSDDSDDSDSGDSSEEGEGEAAQDKSSEPILDKTETNLTSFRRVVYLTIQSSLDVDECAHKLLKGEIKPGWEEELCNMIVDCCAQQRTYIKFYGLLAARFCQLNRVYQECFETTFVAAYKTCHRLETEKLRNVTKLYSHLLYTDAISWQVMECIRLNMDESTSSSRVFIKIMFEELANFMGLAKLNERLHEPTLASAFEGLLPKDNPVNTRFAINFFTTIGLGGLTDGLRDFLRSQPKPTAVVAPVQKKAKSSSEDSSSSSSSSSSDSSSSSSSDSSSSDSDSDSSSSSSDSSDSSSDSSDSSDSDSSSSSESEKERKSSRKKKTKKVQKKPVAVASGRKSSKKKSKPSKEVHKSSKRVSNGKRRT